MIAKRLQNSLGLLKEPVQVSLDYSPAPTESMPATLTLSGYRGKELEMGGLPEGMAHLVDQVAGDDDARECVRELLSRFELVLSEVASTVAGPAWCLLRSDGTCASAGILFQDGRLRRGAAYGLGGTETLLRFEAGRMSFDRVALGESDFGYEKPFDDALREAFDGSDFAPPSDYELRFMLMRKGEYLRPPKLSRGKAVALFSTDDLRRHKARLSESDRVELAIQRYENGETHRLLDLARDYEDIGQVAVGERDYSKALAYFRLAAEATCEFDRACAAGAVLPKRLRYLLEHPRGAWLAIVAGDFALARRCIAIARSRPGDAPDAGHPFLALVERDLSTVTDWLKSHPPKDGDEKEYHDMVRAILDADKDSFHNALSRELQSWKRTIISEGLRGFPDAIFCPSGIAWIRIAAEVWGSSVESPSELIPQGLLISDAASMDDSHRPWKSRTYYVPGEGFTEGLDIIVHEDFHRLPTGGEVPMLSAIRHSGP
ncbi:MAG: hypothetical protein WBX15_17035 [Thermoanaerobaculia bacterium]